MQYLSDEQRHIVDQWTAEGGAMIVEAPAGSGKTRVLTECVRTLLEKNPKEKFKVLCVTFTNKAAEEMQERLKTVKGIKERAFIGTIHAFSLSILKAYRHELGYEEMPHIVEREYDRKEILKKVFTQSTTLEFDEKSELTNTLKWISERKRELILLDSETIQYHDWDFKAVHLYKEYNYQLRNQNLIDFDDILLLAWRILSEKPHVTSLYQRLYKCILVDEAQDLNSAQYQLIELFCGDSIKDILMIGDRNQAIHGYAGASKDYMFEHFVRDFQATSEKIKFNYRSSRKVIELANQIMPKETKDVEHHFEGVAEIHSFKDELAESEWIICKIKELLKINSDEFEGQVTLEKMAVLARNKFVFRKLQECLDKDHELASQYSLKKGVDVLIPESIFMKLFDLGTRLLTNRYGDVYLNQLINLLRIDSKNVSSRSQNGFELLTSLRDQLNGNSPVTQATYNCLLESWQELDRNINQFHAILKKMEDHTKNLEENERDLAQKDIAEWNEAWNSYVRNVPANSKSLADFRRYTAMGFNKSNQSEKGLTLATIHTVKGLEFDIIFLMGMNEGTFPDYRSLKEPALEEERNNAYVAVTRAKRYIYVSYPRQKIMPWGSEKAQEPSQFLSKSEQCQIRYHD